MIYDKSGNPIQMAKKPTRGRTNPNPVIAKIAHTFKDRSRKDIAKWRSAIAVAEDKDNPRRDILIDLITDLLTDGHVQSQMLLRRSAILNTPFQVISKKTGKVDQDKTELIQSKWFYDVLYQCCETTFFGYTVLELLEVVDGKPKFNLVPRKNVVPNKGYVIPDLGNPQETIPFNLPELEKWILTFGNTDNLGALNNIVPNLIWKRNVMQSWAEFCERFGIPLVTATTVRNDDKTLALVEEMLQQLGEAAHAVFPEGTKIDFKDAEKRDTYEVFNQKKKANNEEISKALVGGTMLADDGSSMSQSEVHERNLEERIAPMDRRDISFFINDKLLPLLAEHGIGFGDDDKFVFELNQEIEVAQHWTIVQGLMQQGYEIDEAWLGKTFNVSITGKKKVQTKPNPVAELTRNFNIEGLRLPVYSEDSCCVQSAFKMESEFDTRMHELHDKLYTDIYNERESLGSELRIIALEAMQLLAGLRTGWGDRIVEASWDAPDFQMLAAMELNIWNFASSKTEARLAAMSDLLIDKEKNGIRNFNDFRKLAEKRVSSFNEEWLRTEYDTAVAVGQGTASFNRMWEQREDFPYWQYQTVGDQNVRDSHARLNGLIFKLSDSTARRLIAPNGYKCRCENIQLATNVTEGAVTKGKDSLKLLGKEFTNSEWNVNRAETKEVYTQKQRYTRIHALEAKLEASDYETYNLPTIKELSKGRSALKLDPTITQANVKELFSKTGTTKGGGNYMGFTDYTGRKMILKEKDFKKHVTGDRYNAEGRHQQFAKLNEVLTKPDEVWVSPYEKEFDAIYLKFYGDATLVVKTSLQNEYLNIGTWYKLDRNEKGVRKGIEIKREGS